MGAFISDKLWAKPDSAFLSYYKNYSHNQATSDFVNAEYLKAIGYYQSENTFKAFRHFKNITAIAYLYDWQKPQKNIIASSFLRFAEQIPDLEDHYLREALKFSSKKFLLSLTKDLRTQKSLQKLKLRVQSFPLHHLVQGPKLAILNSKEIWLKREGSIDIPEGEIRLTVISENFKPIHYIGNATAIFNEAWVSKKLSNGSCLHPQLYHESLKNSSYLARHATCDLLYSNGSFKRITRTELDLHMQKEIPVLKSSSFHLKSSLKNMSKKTSNESYDPNYLQWKNARNSKKPTENRGTWRKRIWWGLGILATGYLIHEASKTKTTYTHQ